jgi:hypothetical protein
MYFSWKSGTVKEVFQAELQSVMEEVRSKQIKRKNEYINGY